eukprot:3545623-Amphidinium_carterae.1
MAVSSRSVFRTGQMRHWHLLLTVLCGSQLICATATLTFTPVSKIELQVAVKAWLEDEVVAEAVYGHIDSWNSSLVTDMSMLFHRATTFNSRI